MNRVISMIGHDKDNRGVSDRRWESWRPNISLCSQSDFFVEELYLIHSARSTELFERVVADIMAVSPMTKVIGVELNFEDPWDFASSYFTLYDFAQTLDAENDYYVHITTGTHTTQFAFASLVLNNMIRGQKLIQTRPIINENIDRKKRAQGVLTIVDFSLSKYDELAARFTVDKALPENVLKRGIKTRSDVYNELITRIEKVAIRSNAPMLITGETGAGKTQLVKQLYQVKHDNGMVTGDFIFVNCSTFNGNPEGAKSALFGHKKGAFTGATADRQGFLTRANKGILFLDEIATLGMEEQGMLLHALEEKTFYPLGANKLSTSDFVLVCGTNVDLRRAVAEKTFRADLYARIKMWTFKLPGLRERREDIEPNIHYELAAISTKVGYAVSFTKEAEARYVTFAKSSEAKWLDNFRDLNNSIERMSTLSDRNRIGLDEVNREIDRLKDDWLCVGDLDQTAQLNVADYVAAERLSTLSMIDTAVLRTTLEICLSHDTGAEAARELYADPSGKVSGSNPTSRLFNYLKRFDLNFAELKG